MISENDFDNDEGRYFTELSAAFVRGKLGIQEARTAKELIDIAGANGLRLHKFKRNTDLPRVKKVLGSIKGLAPSNLLDIGSGRGTFLWPLLDEFPYLPVTAIDLNPQRVTDMDAVRLGGIENLRAFQMDVTRLEFEDGSFDLVTALEVLEHLPDASLAASEIIRVARNHVVASVPSKEDDNPEHIQLFTRASFEALWMEAGARSVKIDYVLNHLIAVAKV